MTLAAARAVADAVLYEGYLLYPYRSTAGKNQVRWQFGIVGPPGAVEAGAGEEPTMRSECLLEVREGAAARLAVHVRFLQVQVRATERAVDGGFEPVDELTVGPATWIRWHEAVERSAAYDDLSVDDHGEPRTYTVEIPAGEDVEVLTDGGDERVVGRLVRTRFALRGEVRVQVSRTDRDELRRVSVELVNLTEWTGAEDGVDRARDVAARASFVGAHLLLAAQDAAFVSITDPPEWAAEAAAACSNHRCWPVLVGEPGSTDVVLASPIILADHPEVAPESPGQLYDSTEIDEILTLRIMTLTDDEKRAARGTDPRAGAIIDRSDSMPPEIFERLHGALRGLPAVTGLPALDDLGLGRGPSSQESELFPGQVQDHGGGDDVPTFGTAPWWNPSVDAAVSPEHDTVQIEGVAVGKGTRVRLHPSGRGDAQDMFVDGLTALVTGVYFDVDGDTHVAVVVEDDPAAELHDWYGRYSYFRPEELEPLVDSTHTGHLP